MTQLITHSISCQWLIERMSDATTTASSETQKAELTIIQQVDKEMTLKELQEFAGHLKQYTTKHLDAMTASQQKWKSMERRINIAVATLIVSTIVLVAGGIFGGAPFIFFVLTIKISTLFMMISPRLIDEVREGDNHAKQVLADYRATVLPVTQDHFFNELFVTQVLKKEEEMTKEKGSETPPQLFKKSCREWVISQRALMEFLCKTS